MSTSTSIDNLNDRQWPVSATVSAIDFTLAEWRQGIRLSQAGEVPERVAFGATCLDRAVPGWHWLVRPEELEILDCIQCVVGQLTGDYSDSHHVLVDGDLPHSGHVVDMEFKRDPVGRVDALSGMGFALTGNVGDDIPDASFDVYEEVEARELEAHWVDEIWKRRNRDGYPPKPDTATEPATEPTAASDTEPAAEPATTPATASGTEE